MGCCVIVVSGVLDWDITFKAQGWCEVWGCWSVGMGRCVALVSGTSHYLAIGRGGQSPYTQQYITYIHYITLPHITLQEEGGPTTI